MYAFCQDMPGITLDHQAKLDPLLPPEALNGCVVHVVGAIEGGTRMIDVWETEQQYRAFQKTYLAPALAKLQQQMPLDTTRNIPPFTVLEVTGTGHVAVGAA